MKYTIEFHAHNDADMPDLTGWYIVGRDSFGTNPEYGCCTIVGGPYTTREAAEIDAPIIIGG